MGMAARLGGLAAWCAGFLSGFGAVVTSSVNALPDEVGEALRDYASISGRVDDEQVDNEDEASFMELYEYVRVAAVLMMTLMAEHTESGEQANDEVEH